MKQIQNVILLCDCSTSMDGEPIDAVRSGIYALKNKIDTLNSINKNVEVKVNIIGFATNAFWIGDIRHFNGIEASGCTSMHLAFSMLNDKLHNFYERKYPPLPPILILMSDGMPTDMSWQSELNALYNYKPFRNSTRFAVAYNTYSSDTLWVLQQFVGNNNVLQLFSVNDLTRTIENSISKVAKHCSYNKGRCSKKDVARLIEIEKYGIYRYNKKYKNT